MALLSPFESCISPIVSEATQTITEYEFIVTGMTCVACSNNIERNMHKKFDEKGLNSISVVLLTNKLQASFIRDTQDYTAKFDDGMKDQGVNSSEIVELVSGLGFSCTLTNSKEQILNDSST